MMKRTCCAEWETPGEYRDVAPYFLLQLFIHLYICQWIWEVNRLQMTMPFVEKRGHVEHKVKECNMEFIKFRGKKQMGIYGMEEAKAW